MPDIYEQLILHEAIKLKPYRDSAGKLTIGIGRNLDDKGITREEAIFLCKNDIQAAISQLERYDWYNSLDDIRKKVLLDMAFNLGVSGLLKFKKMIKAIEEKNFVCAGKEMKDSQWAKEVKTRADRLISMMISGEDYKS